MAATVIKSRRRTPSSVLTSGGVPFSSDIPLPCLFGRYAPHRAVSAVTRILNAPDAKTVPKNGTQADSLARLIDEQSRPANPPFGYRSFGAGDDGAAR
ncbi:hypothetical protein ERY430_41067 [Erythrobacter sp. EC-HK427]|nr:hypothetical protein ERY430_41067 [Erythrobacter sp. EC-HK427]